MIVEFGYTLEDLKEASRAHAKAAAKGFGARRHGSPRWLVWAAFGAVALLLVLKLLMTHTVVATPPIVPPPNQNPLSSNILAPILPWLLILSFIWFFVFRARAGVFGVKRVWDSHPSLQLRRTFDVDASRLIINDGQTRIERQWSSIRRFLESENLVLLYTSDLAFDMIPKRAFASQEQLDEFRRLLEQQIQPPTGGFPVQPLQPPPPA